MFQKYVTTLPSNNQYPLMGSKPIVFLVLRHVWGYINKSYCVTGAEIRVLKTYQMSNKWKIKQYHIFNLNKNHQWEICVSLNYAEIMLTFKQKQFLWEHDAVTWHQYISLNTYFSLQSSLKFPFSFFHQSLMPFIWSETAHFDWSLV